MTPKNLQKNTNPRQTAKLRLEGVPISPQQVAPIFGHSLDGILCEAQQKFGNVIGGGGAAERRGGLLPLDPLAGAVCEGFACRG